MRTEGRHMCRIGGTCVFDGATNKGRVEKQAASYSRN